MSDISSDQLELITQSAAIADRIRITCIENATLRAENDDLHKGLLRGSTMMACPSCGRGTRPRYLRNNLCGDCTASERLDLIKANEALHHDNEELRTKNSLLGRLVHQAKDELAELKSQNQSEVTSGS